MDTQNDIHKNIETKLQSFYENKEVPHLLFHGNSGTGKKTIVHHFIQTIYGGNKSIIKENVMYVNCSQGKGIKFIREELKFFAKTNLQVGTGIQFKTIVLLNADFLTVDAQSALRRCIELFSYNTRFFIIVENKNKLLKPILSRFCEIFVPDTVNFNRLQVEEASTERKRKHEWIKTHFVYDEVPSAVVLTQWSNSFYQNGISCLDFIDFMENNENIDPIRKNKVLMFYYKIKSEFRCDPLLFFAVFDFFFHHCDSRLLQICKI
jgi:hypothetical protein